MISFVAGWVKLTSPQWSACRFIPDMSPPYISSPAQRKSDVRHMYAYLVRTPGLQCDLQKRVGIVPADALKMRDRPLTLRSNAPRDYAVPGSAYRSVHGIPRRSAAGNGEIHLGKRPGERRGSVLILCAHAEPARVAVQPVYRSERKSRIQRREQVREGVPAVAY